MHAHVRHSIVADVAHLHTLSISLSRHLIAVVENLQLPQTYLPPSVASAVAAADDDDDDASTKASLLTTQTQ